MSEPFLGEIRMFAGYFAPRDWMTCDGQLLPISQYSALFSILGTTYGGNGQTNFALPNLGGSAPLCAGNGPGLTPRDLGEAAGQESVTLIAGEMPQHTHALDAATQSGTHSAPGGNVWAAPGVGRGVKAYDPARGAGPAMSGQALSVSGSSSPHNNMPPYLVLTFIIAIAGVFPSRP